jgi:hypothetical protein
MHNPCEFKTSIAMSTAGGSLEFPVRDACGAVAAVRYNPPVPLWLAHTARHTRRLRLTIPLREGSQGSISYDTRVSRCSRLQRPKV